ncbi:MAG: AarF/ABC1/UbiB kinase family protein [Chloroflexi bacterium]|nr:AarF/ABC1/UbiB kinase family protein [Chloroflexota bacterium]MCI0578421.1 AarF/ABC1/UbiB kinase family protein [Chloroflexota bacterium]MCI0648161.1 AarF/ABC1/UbiB kinase family protein [Chloroflexota bacterium]MCI0726676.1 AarF/ABC1/UbiB kinase family protein [Chloroflexota bacterium]
MTIYPDGDSPASGFLGSIPRREPAVGLPVEGSLAPIIQGLHFESGFARSLRRLLTWFYFFTYLLGGIIRDKLHGNDTVERRAARLREGLEKAGGTFVKFGQQAAMRIDLLPWEYCTELNKMLDEVPPFPTEEALQVVQRTTGKPWQEIFAVFDPEPIGSASIACVYQALLKDGTKVAVKVRRPGIGQLFAADFRVLDWLFGLLEFLTVLRPGFTRYLRVEFRETLLEELDFTKEARFQDIFRRNAEACPYDFFSAPKVFFELSGPAVIVQEFVSGMWLWEVIAVKEFQDERGLAKLRELNIDPRLVAKRILWTNHWSMSENLFFHADPHPANILVRPNSKLTFIDFGSCGSFNFEQKMAIEQIILSTLNRDAEGAARATLTLMEPFPPVDVPQLMKEAVAEYKELIFTFETDSDHIEWWERTSARQWMAMVRITRSHNLPLGLHTLRMIRATLLADTLVLRLDHTVNRYEEYADFLADRAGFVKARLRDQVRRTFLDESYLRLEELLETGEEALWQAQHRLSSPFVTFNSVVDKATFTVSVLSRMAWRIFLATLIATVLVSLRAYQAERGVDPAQTMGMVLSNRLYLLVILLIVVLNLRHIIFRLRDPDPD